MIPDDAAKKFAALQEYLGRLRALYAKGERPAEAAVVDEIIENFKAIEANVLACAGLQLSGYGDDDERFALSPEGYVRERNNPNFEPDDDDLLRVGDQFGVDACYFRNEVWRVDALDPIRCARVAPPQSERLTTSFEEKYRWVLPVITGVDDSDTNRRVKLIAAALVVGLSGDTMIEAAMDQYHKQLSQSR